LPVSYSIDPDLRLVISRIWGTVTNDDVNEHDRQLRADPLLDPTYSQLADMSEVTLNLVSSNTVQETAREQFFVPGARRAFVVSDDASYGMCRKYATHAESFGQVITIFRDRNEAEAWLGLKDQS
jgi:hypothetical protein